MSWASHPTTEMPTKPSSSNGRHRARTRAVIGIVAVGALALVVIVATFAPSLIGWPPPSNQTSQTSALSGASTPSSSPTAPASSTDGSATPTPTPTSTSTSTSTPTATPITVSVADSAGLEAEVFALTNVERQERGCPALRLDPGLAAAARGHSVDMARTGSFGHPGSDGSDPGQRMTSAGYDATAGWAENIARGQTSPTAVMVAWMGSEDHRANIVDCNLTALGVGAARGATGQIYWTQDFGAH